MWGCGMGGRGLLKKKTGQTRGQNNNQSNASPGKPSQRGNLQKRGNSEGFTGEERENIGQKNVKERRKHLKSKQDEGAKGGKN